MTEAAKEARRNYQKEWRQRNPEKVKQYMEKYWSSRAEKVESARQKTAETAEPVKHTG